MRFIKKTIALVVVFSAALLAVNAQQKLSGKVIDESNGEELIGVTVVIDGTTIGSITDYNGEYSIAIPEGQNNPLINFSYIGYATKKVPLNGRTRIDISLELDVSELEEVVVVGYGNQKRADVSYAIESIDAKSIEGKALTSVDQALQGEVAGVNVTQSSGAPGGGISVQIRGVQTVTAGAEPLYVIDGFPFYSGGGGTGANPLNTINPADIQSIDILKDAASTSIYGSRGANGVIIITTKRGKTGEAKIQFNMYEGVQSLARGIDMMGASEFMEFQKEARDNYYTMLDPDHSASDNNRDRFLNVGNNAMIIEDSLYLNYPGNGRGTDWYDEIFRTAAIRNYQMSALGGSEKVSYLMSGGYFEQEGIVKGTNFKRFSLRANIDGKLNENIKVGISIAPTLALREDQNTAGNFAAGGLINAASVLAPIYPVYDTLGNYFSPRVQGPDRFFTNFQVNGRFFNTTRPAMPSAENPYRLLSTRLNESTSFRNIGSIYADITFLKNFTFRTSLGSDIDMSDSRSFTKAFSQYPEITGISPPSGSTFTSRTFNWVYENTLTYDLNINYDHRLNFTINYSAQKEQRTAYSTNASEYESELSTYVDSRLAGQVIVTPFIEEWSLISQLARAQYVFKDRYLFTASVRRDGSSRFGPDERYGIFPSGSFGWRFTEENFFPKTNVLNDGKLRMSYGVVGNFNIGNYDWIGEVSTLLYPLGSVDITNPVRSGSRQTTQGNSGLSWETSRQFNAGIDFGFFDNRITSAIDYYTITTDGLLLNANLPLVSGFLSSLRNVGEVMNTGVEFSISSRNLVQDFKWTTDFNISFNKNEVIALASDGDQIISGQGGINITKPGYPIGSFFMIPTEGIYMNQAAVDANYVLNQGAEPYVGARQYIDSNGDGIISDADREISGNPFPDYTFGFINTFEYKSFDLRVQVYGSIGAEIVNRGRQVSENGQGFHNNTMRYWENRFISEENPGDGNSPKAVATTRLWNNQLTGSYQIEDGSFVRIRNVVFGYRLPANIAKSIFVSSARIYASAQNLFTFTNYTGFDPEVSSGGTGVLTRGLDFGGYPIPRTFTVGLDINF